MTLATALLSALLAAAPADPPPITLVGAGALGAGSSAWMVEGGYPGLAVSYAQGVGAWDDLGATVGLDWTTAEMAIALTWRKELAGDAGSRAGVRLAVGPTFDFGATWAWANNTTNVGILLAPGAAWTASAGPGLASVGLDAGMVWDFQRGGGFAFAPRLSVAYEAPVARDLTLGARAGLWVRWAGGSAAIPGMDDRILGGLSLVLTWRVF